MQNSGLFTEVVNLSQKWNNIKIIGTIKYKAAENRVDTLCKVETLVSNMLTYKFTPKLNYINHAKNSTTDNFTDYLKAITPWYEGRKALYKVIYDRNLKLINLQIIKHKEIIRFKTISQQENISINNSPEDIIYILEKNNFTKMSTRVINNAENYKCPKQLEYDWYKSEDAGYNYIFGETVYSLSSDKHVKMLNYLNERLEIMLEDIRPFKYASKWQKTINLILEMYNNNIETCWCYA